MTVRNDRDQEPNDKNEYERDKEDEETVKDKETDDSKVQVLCLPYVKGVSEKIEKTCKGIGPTKLKVVFKPFRTMRQMLMMKVKNPVPAEKQKGVVYEILRQDCAQVYVGETCRTLRRQKSSHCWRNRQ